MKMRKLLLLLPLLFIFAAAACDSETSGQAQDLGAGAPDPVEEDVVTCPCFSENDVMDMGDGTESIECAYTIFGIALLFDMSGSDSLTAICGPDGTGCMCSNGDSEENNITQDEFGSCMSNLLSSIAQFNTETVKLVGCSFD